MRIAVTDTMGSEHKFQMYNDWLRMGDPELESVRLSYKIDNLTALKECDGLVLTGGHDVFPPIYGGPIDHVKVTEVDTKRDDFERRAIDCALQGSMPILGICRGLQLMNVHQGGTLILDIEEAGYRSHKKEIPGVENNHRVFVEKGSFLDSITHAQTGTVNSSHHQAVRDLGKDLRSVAFSDDGIIEAMEWVEPEGKPFFLLVQWHPERMSDRTSPFSGNILKNFLNSILETRDSLRS